MRAALMLSLLPLLAAAQTEPATTQLPDQFVAAGLAFNQYAAPNLNGWSSFAKAVKKDAGLYSFTTYELSSARTTPFTLQTSVRTGLALALRSVGPVVIFGFGDAGMAASGTTLSGAFSGGGMAALPLGKGWVLVVPVRVVKSAVGGQQVIFELGAGWGK